MFNNCSSIHIAYLCIYAIIHSTIMNKNAFQVLMVMTFELNFLLLINIIKLNSKYKKKKSLHSSFVILGTWIY